jgi:hypothetical protein
LQTSEAVLREGNKSGTCILGTVAEEGVYAFDIYVEDVGAITPRLEFTYLPFPIIYDLFPSIGSFAGGTTMFIRGVFQRGVLNYCYFSHGPVVKARYDANDDSKVVCLVPPADGPGRVTVHVSSAGRMPSGPAMTFEYVVEPSIDFVTPQMSGRSGGINVTLKGRDFQADFDYFVRFGDLAANCVYLTKEQIRCIAPSLTTTAAITTVELAVSVNGGNQFTRTGAFFTYTDEFEGKVRLSVVPRISRIPIEIYDLALPSLDGVMCNFGYAVTEPDYERSNVTRVNCIARNFPGDFIDLGLVNKSEAVSPEITPRFRIPVADGVEVEGVEPAQVPTGEGAYTVRLRSGIGRIIGCRLWPSDDFSFGKLVEQDGDSGTIACLSKTRAAGRYTLQLGWMAKENVMNTSITVTVYDVPSIIAISPPVVYVDSAWEVTITGEGFVPMLGVGCRITDRNQDYFFPGIVLTEETVRCFLQALPSGSYSFVVVPNGIHGVRSPLNLTVSNIPRIGHLSTQPNRAVAEGTELTLTGMRIYGPLECAFGHENPPPTSKARVFGTTEIRCPIPRGLEQGLVDLELLLAGQPLSSVLQTYIHMQVMITATPRIDRLTGLTFLGSESQVMLEGQGLDGGGVCAGGLPTEPGGVKAVANATEPGYGAICSIFTKDRTRSSVQFQLYGDTSFLAGARRYVPTIPRPVAVATTPSRTWPAGRIMLIKGANFTIAAELGVLYCRIQRVAMVKAALIDDETLQCKAPDLAAFEGGPVTVALVAIPPEREDPIVLSENFVWDVLLVPRLRGVHPRVHPAGLPSVVSIRGDLFPPSL